MSNSLSDRRFVFEGVPSYFIGCCQESKGHPKGYSHAGYHLAIHVEGSDIPYDASFEDWEGPIALLKRHILARNDRAIIRWFCDHYPRCMELVPKRRRSSFVDGVYRAAAREWEIGPYVS